MNQRVFIVGIRRDNTLENQKELLSKLGMDTEKMSKGDIDNAFYSLPDGEGLKHRVEIIRIDDVFCAGIALGIHHDFGFTMCDIDPIKLDKEMEELSKVLGIEKSELKLYVGTRYS